MSAANRANRLVRREPIDFEDIARQTGMRKGKLCHTPFGWAVQNTHGLDGADVALIETPPLRAEESEIRIEDNHWCFYKEI